MSRKKGLSEVVTTVIIILLSLVAVGIVWVVVKNVVSSGAEGVSLGMFTNSLVIKSVVLENNSVLVDVKRNSGGDNITFVKFIFENGTDSQTVEKQTTLQELEQKTFSFYLSDLLINNISKVSIAAVYVDSSGKIKLGNVVANFKLKNTKAFSGTGTGWVSKNFENYGPVGVGKAVYGVSSAGGLFPKFEKVIIDPLDVKVGDNQTFTVYLSSSYNITEVTTVTQLDKEVLTLPLIKVVDGVYSATWKVYDTHTQVYRTNFTAKDSGGNVNFHFMTWTDPCTGFAHGTTSTVTTGCTISTIDGVDNGNIVIGQGGSITINDGATLAYAPGYSVSKTGTGSISLGSTGIITKQYLFYPDVDGDSYAKNGTLSTHTSTTFSQKVRAASALSTSDANDADINCWVNKYTDADADGYCNGSGLTCVGSQAGYASSCNAYTDCNDASGTVWQTLSCEVDADNDDYCGANADACVGAACAETCAGAASGDCNDANGTFWATGYGIDNDGDNYGQSTSGCNNGASPLTATAGQDCYDSNASAYPGQTSYFTVSRGDASYDYDCSSGTEEKQYTTVGVKRVCVCDGGCTGVLNNCLNSVVGNTGWQTSVPACGVGDTYYTGLGDPCLTREAPIGCTTDYTTSEARTQSCR
mgnify:CR=1 FL=1